MHFTGLRFGEENSAIGGKIYSNWKITIIELYETLETSYNITANYLKVRALFTHWLGDLRTLLHLPKS